MNTFDLSLDLDKRAGVTQWVTMRQGDHDGTQLRATIYDHGTQVSDSYTCRVSIRKPTDNEYYRETCSFSGGVAIVTVDEQYAASEVGITYGYFELLQGTAVIASTENFGVRILQSAIDGAIVAPPYDSAIEDALAELDEATGRISQMVIDATAEYLEAHPEITTTVQDNSITDAKLIQKGGILQREQWLETMLPNIPRKATSEADVHSVTDSAGGGPLGISVYGRSTQDGTPTPDAPVAIESVGPDADGGVKLLCMGRNLWGLGSVTQAQRCTYQLTDTGIMLTGNATTSYCYVNVQFKGLRGTCTLHFDVQADLGHAVQVAAQGGAVLVSRSEVSTATFTIPDGVDFISVYLYVKSDSSGTHTATFTNVQLEVGSAATPYQPYTSVTIPIDLQGHSLRSLPDGTRDEVNVDEWGHAVLTQRVGFLELPADIWGASSGNRYRHYVDAEDVGLGTGHYTDMYCTAYQPTANTSAAAPANTIRFAADGLSLWLAAGSTLVDSEVTYILAEPRTIDLGYLDPALLPAPDLTAYVVPSAPSVLRYGFDVAAAIAEIATA